MCVSLSWGLLKLDVDQAGLKCTEIHLPLPLSAGTKIKDWPHLAPFSLLIQGLSRKVELTDLTKQWVPMALLSLPLPL